MPQHRQPRTLTIYWEPAEPADDADLLAVFTMLISEIPHNLTSSVDELFSKQSAND
jgi:hypothetical protein